MSTDSTTTRQTATRIIHWAMTIVFVGLLAFSLYKWLALGETTPLWLLTFMAAMGAPAAADIALPNHDARAMVVWSCAMLAGSLLLCSVEMREPQMGWFGLVFVVVSFGATLIPNALALKDKKAV
jgi:hypothetical protein